MSPPVTRRKRRKTQGASGGAMESRESSVASVGSLQAESNSIPNEGGKVELVQNDKEVGPGSGSLWYAAELGGIGAQFRTLVLADDRVPREVAKALLDLAAQYEGIVVRQTTELAKLEGRLLEREEVQTAEKSTRHVVQSVVSGSKDAAGSPKMSRPAVGTQTYAVVVRSAVEGDSTAGEEIKRKILDVSKSVGPVKVKSVRTLRDGGVAIVASTPADVRRIRSAPAFAAAGLSVADAKLGEPHLIVSGIPASLTDAELIGGLITPNLTGVATSVELRSIRVIRRNKRGPENVDVVLDVPKKLRECMLNEGRLYSGWMSYRVREFESVPQCYGCGSYGHLLARCSFGRLCHNCGEAGHAVGICTKQPKCRNCSLRGMVATHRVTSQSCPCYQRECERRRNRVIG